MSQMGMENSEQFSHKKSLFLMLSAIIFCLGLSISYSSGILPLEGIFLLLILPFLLLLFLIRQEAILLAIVASYFGSAYFFPDDLIAQSLLRGALLFLIGLMLILRFGAKREITRIVTPLDKIIFIWLGVIFASFFYGFYFKGNETGYLMGDLYKFVEIISVFWLTTFIVRTRREIRFLIWGFLFVVLILGAIDSVVFFVQMGFVGDILKARVRAGAQFSSIFAFILAVTLILHEKRTIPKLILTFLSLAFLLSFILSFLRTGYIVIPPTLVIILFLYFYKNKNRAFEGIRNIALLIFILFVFLISFNIIVMGVSPELNIIKATFTRFSTLIDPYSGDPMGIRTQETESIISQVLSRSPLLGNGLGGKYYSAEKVAGEIYWTKKHYVHINYLDFVVRTGVLGLFVFFILVFKYLKDVIKFYLRSKDDFYQGVLLGCMGIFISSLMIALSVSIFYCPLIFLIIAITYCIANIEEKTRLKTKRNE